MSRKGISLVSYGQFEKNFLEQLAHKVKSEFDLQVRLSAEYTDLAAFFDPSRHQYDANRLLQFIHSKSDNKDTKTIGLFQVDLFIPILTYIFGQAIFKGETGIVSIYRLKNELYGLPRNNELLFKRLQKVVIHELGHTFGLIHCHVPSCVMRSTTYVEEIDQKKYHFCNKCLSELEQLMKNLDGE